MTARAVAMARIARAAHRFPDVDFRAAEDEAANDALAETGALDVRDAALASAIEHVVLRRWLTLVAVIEAQMSRPWHETENKLQAALLCGAAQLLLLDRLPEYAVIDETVEWAKTNIHPKTGGFVNAVLRKVAALRGERLEAVASTQVGLSAFSWAVDQLPLHDGRVWQLKSSVFADDPLRRTAQQTSHSIDLLEQWIALFGVERAAALSAHSLVHAPIILHGPPAATATFDAATAAAHELQPHEQPGYFVAKAHGRASIAELLREHPQLIVQDPAAAAAVEATRNIHPAPRVIIDGCAGRGTKTRQLALAFPDAEIIATDVDRDRLRSLSKDLAEHGRVQVIEHRRLIEFVGKADLVVLDVPCSNTGVLARRVEAKYRFTRASLRSLVDVQRQIVADALRLVSDRGWIAYTTCSIDPAENAQQAAWITQWHPFMIHLQESRNPVGLPGECATKYRDGGYWALLRKKA